MTTKIKKKDFPEFLEALKSKYKIDSISIYFDGGGDSGEVGEPTAETEIITIDENGKKVSTKEEVDLSQDEIETLRTFFEMYLETTEHDWYNNEGGYGDITLDLNTGKITCDMSIRVTESIDYQLSDEEFAKRYNL